jgi:hypothetical protein
MITMLYLITKAIASNSSKTALVVMSLGLLGLFSCVNDQPTPIPDPVYFGNDPVARSDGFSVNNLSIRGMATGLKNGLVNGQLFDAALTIQRAQQWSGYESSDVQAAFNVGGQAVKIGGVVLNGFNVPWLESDNNGMTMGWFPQSYVSGDSSTYGTSDSSTFSYSDFDGASYMTKVFFADFGKITIPDTIVTSKGLAIGYAKHSSQDSIVLDIQPVDSTSPSTTGWLEMVIPDSGTIVLPPNFILPGKNLWAWNISISRMHFTSIASPQGKRIGVSTWQSVNAYVPARP